MTGKDNFEKKIKAKLEEVNTPYEESAWLNFAPILDAPSIPIWKRWYMPYLYSTMLFVLAGIWFFQKNGSTSNLDGIDIKNSIYLADTIYRQDTVWIIDTVYVIKKVVIEELEKTQRANQDNQIKESSFTLSAPSQNDGLKSEKQDSKTIINDQGNVKEKEVSENTVSTVSEAKTPHSTDSLKTKPVIQENQAKSSIDYNKPSRNTIMAPSIGPEETFVMKLDKELVEGDTSNLNHTPTKKNRNKPYFNLEAGLSLLIPVNRQIEYYPSFTQYFNMGIEWENGIGLYTGIMRSQIKGEIDDDDFSSFSPSILGDLPGRPADILDIDEIYLTNKQWYFPVEFRWRSLYYSGFSFESSFGLVGNYLARQDFQYEFEDRVGLSDQFESIAIRQFRISHLKVGLGTNYLLSGRWGMFLRSHYWLPISDVGVLKNRTHGLEVGFGINYFLGR